MGFFSRFAPFVYLGDDQFAVNLDTEVRQLVVDLASQLNDIDDIDNPLLRRLFPTAYPQDAERDAGYQIFARSARLEQRSEQLTILHDTVEATTMSGQQLSAWMGVINDLRLVLGTSLDLSEDEDPTPTDEHEAATLHLYHVLSEVLSHLVDALTRSLPQPPDTCD